MTRWSIVLVGSVLASMAQAAILGEAAGTGPWPAVAESRAELSGHTFYRPAVWPRGPLPLYIWGNGACRDNGLAHAAYLRQVASHGYVVVALGRPRDEQPAGQAPAPAAPRATPDETQVSQMLEALDWASRENARAGGDYQGHIDLDHVAVGGHSCGGLQALSLSADPRIDTTLVLNSGIPVRRDPAALKGVQIDKSQLARLHGPMLYLTGGPGDIAHPNASDDVARLEHVPVFFGALPVGHGGTFAAPNGGDWARVTVRWLDWQLKADADASWDFAGAVCRMCSDRRWNVVQKHLPSPTGPFRQSLYVPVRDGTLLAVNLYRPAQDGVPVSSPLPTLFSFTPYRARYRDASGRVVELGQFSREMADSLLAAGYVLAVADIRGKGASFGARRGFSDRTEAYDGYDLVQWLASRAWSDGKVGMYGCSYLGGTTVHVASTAPPALRAIFTGATDLDKFAFVRAGGITAQFNTRADEPLSDDLMSLPLDVDADGALLRAAVAQHARNTPMAALWYGMPFRDSVSSLTGNRFWEEAGPYTYLDALKRSGIATYLWSNFQDEPTAQVILAAENLGGQLLLGPGTHCVPPPGFDFNGAVQGFFDRTVKGLPASSAPPPVTWWLAEDGGKGSWNQAARWPGVAAPRQTWYLSGAALQPQRGPASRPSFKVDYSVASNEAFAFWVDTQHGHGLSFTSLPLQSPQDLVGFPVLHLRVASDRPEPLLFGYLEQVSPAGEARVLSFGRLGAAYRKTGTAPYLVAGLPWHTGLAADYAPLARWREAMLDFAFTPVAQVIPAGYRLRLVVTGADPRQRNLAQIRQDPPPTIRLSLGGSEGSRLELPLRPRIPGT